MFGNKNKIINKEVSPEEVYDTLKEHFPGFVIKNKSRKLLRITMKRKIFYIDIMRTKKGKFIIRKDTPIFIEFITLGTVELLELFIGQKERAKVFTILKEKFSTV